MKPQEYITTKTAAKEINLKPRTIQDWCRTGKIKAKRFGVPYFIERSYWEKWKNENLAILARESA